MIPGRAAALAAVLSLGSGLAAAEMVFVKDGAAVAVNAIGPVWQTREGALECAGQNTIAHRLLAGSGLGQGDFTIRARLAVVKLANSSAALVLGEDTFLGFAGGHGKVFVTGPWFGNASGKPIGEPTDFMKDGTPFELACSRQGDELTVAIDGREVYRQKPFHAGPVPCFGFTPVRATLRVESFTASGTAAPYQAPTVFVAKPPVLCAAATALPQLPMGPFVRLGDGTILTVDEHTVLTSGDAGRTWQKGAALFAKPEAFATRPERALLCSREGVLLLIFLNQPELRYAWDKEANAPLPEMRLPSYCLRSEDGGKSWSEPIRLYNGWCGAIRDIIQTDSGAIVVPGQELLLQEGRHCTRAYVSRDLGKTWTYGQVLDIGGRGDHAGAVEATLVQLRDRRIRMLIRSSHGCFYDAWSTDDGATWSAPERSRIEASGAPGMLKRLADGRLVLAWNPLYLAGTTTRQQRTELAVAFSRDEGETWTPSAVLARNADGNVNNANRVAYPYLYEPRPGYLWVTSMQGGLRCGVAVADLEAAVR